MKRLSLTKHEKEVLRILCTKEKCPSDYPLHVFASCVQSLEVKGLAKGMWATGHILVSARLTDYGEAYIAIYPSLRNPIDWKFVSAVTAIVSLIISIIALFLACTK